MILVAGCSYTEPMNNVWPTHLFGIDHNNIGVAGASNQYIYLSVLNHVLNRSVPEYVYVLATGLHRISVPLSRGHDTKLGNNGVVKHPFPKITTLETAGPMGHWNEVLPESYQNLIRELYWPLDENYLSIQGIIPLISLFSFLDSYNIKYNWTTMYDYAQPQVGMHDNHSFGSLKPTNNLWAALPWGKFLGPTPYEFAMKHDGFRDGVHLDEKTQIAWADEIKKTMSIT